MVKRVGIAIEPEPLRTVDCTCSHRRQADRPAAARDLIRVGGGRDVRVARRIGLTIVMHADT